MGIPSRLSINPLVARPLLPLGKLSVFSFFHYPSHDKISICLFLLYASHSLLEWIRTWFSHYLPLWHASSGPAVCYLFWAKCNPNKAFTQKELQLEIQNRLFSPHHQTTPFKSLNCGPTSPILARYK